MMAGRAGVGAGEGACSGGERLGIGGSNTPPCTRAEQVRHCGRAQVQTQQRSVC